MCSVPIHVAHAKHRDDTGFTLIELLIVVAITGIIAAIAVPGLLKARVSANEASAISSMRAISSAQMTFSSTCARGGFAADLADLVIGPSGGDPFLGPDIANAIPGGTPKSGYVFTLTGTGNVILDAADTCNGAANDAQAGYFAIGDPVSSTTGDRFFGLDHSGNIRVHSAQLSDMTDGQPLQ
jgi:prepilin-type N-terminal cleavage/methylation domain-containing protein